MRHGEEPPREPQLDSRSSVSESANLALRSCSSSVYSCVHSSHVNIIKTKQNPAASQHPRLSPLSASEKPARASCLKTPRPREYTTCLRPQYRGTHSCFPSALGGLRPGVATHPGQPPLHSRQWLSQRPVSDSNLRRSALEPTGLLPPSKKELESGHLPTATVSFSCRSNLG